METLITIVHLLVCVFLVLVVLLQSGRSGGMGAALGGASGQVFGGRGAGGFLAKITTAAAVTFFVTSLTLSVMSSRQKSVVAESQAAAEAEEPSGVGDDSAATAEGDTADTAAEAGAAESPDTETSDDVGADATGESPTPTEAATPTEAPSPADAAAGEPAGDAPTAQ